MKLAFEKTPVINLEVDLKKKGISIGDDLSLAMTDKGDFFIYFQPNQSFLSRIFINKRPRRLGQLETEVSDELAACLDPNDHVRIRVVDATPKYLAKDGVDSLFVSIWISD
jgi:hypothetical protein